VVRGSSELRRFVFLFFRQLSSGSQTGQIDSIWVSTADFFILL
jgi:hypothetical protein